MVKPRRGSNAKKNDNWRGTCPICLRKRVKVLWNVMHEGKTILVCKKCGSGKNRSH